MGGRGVEGIVTQVLRVDNDPPLTWPDLAGWEMNFSENREWEKERVVGVGDNSRTINGETNQHVTSSVKGKNNLGGKLGLMILSLWIMSNQTFWWINNHLLTNASYAQLQDDSWRSLSAHSFAKEKLPFICDVGGPTGQENFHASLPLLIQLCCVEELRTPLCKVL